ncbi:PTS system mannose/fructose/sorbose family transporter subunit IID [[Clostridium] innocuum]
MKIENSDPILVQQILDEIIPGILPLAVIALIFFAIKKKGMKFNLYIIIIIVLSLVGAFFDIV